MSRVLYALVVSIIALTPVVRSQTPTVSDHEDHANISQCAKANRSRLRLLRIAHVNHRFCPRLWQS